VALNVTTERYYLRPIDREVTYRIQLLAYNEIGDGPRCDVITIGQSLTMSIRLLQANFRYAIHLANQLA